MAGRIVERWIAEHMVDARCREVGLHGRRGRIKTMGADTIGKAVAARIFPRELRKPRIDLDQAY